MTSTTQPDPSAILAAAKAPQHPGVYLIGPYARRITFYSQQVRALRLAHAIHRLRVIGTGERVAVVGAGAAGVTTALALGLLGVDVALYDPAMEVLALQSASSRMLHPHIYEWPALGSLDDRAGLPVLDWVAGDAGSVCNALRAEFVRAEKALGNLSVFRKHRLTGLARASSGWKIEFSADGLADQRIYQHVILSMGFGDERGCGSAVPEDYWAPASVGTPATEREAGATYLVSGNGDGALTDVLALLVADFEHVAFTRRFLGLFAGDDLRAAAEKVFDGAVADQDVEARLRAEMLGTLRLHGALDRLRPILRRDRAVTINSSGPLYAAGKAAQLNQIMVFAVLMAAELESLEVRRSSGHMVDVSGPAGSMTPVGISIGTDPVVGPFKHVKPRHGPDLVARYLPAARVLEDYKAHVEPLLATGGDFAAPPVLSPETHDFFEELWIERTADQASKYALLELARGYLHVVEIITDSATHSVVQKGNLELTEIARTCDGLTQRVHVHLHVPPSRLAEATDLVRLARSSGGNLELRAGQDVLAAWAALLPGIGIAPPARSVRPASKLTLGSLSSCVDDCLLRALDRAIRDVIDVADSPRLGRISRQILDRVAVTWDAWHGRFAAEEDLRSDFLRWLAHVDQSPSRRPWDGNCSVIQPMANALIMTMAATCAVPLVPMCNGSGNLRFELDAVALGTGCSTVGSAPIADLEEPDDWGVDALILSESGEVEVRNPPGRVMDGGTRGTSMKTARRVSPAIIQNSKTWRARLQGDLATWVDAVLEEFAELRKRQDAELKAIS